MTTAVERDLSGVSAAAAERFPARRIRRRMAVMLLAFFLVFTISFSLGRFFVPPDKVLLIILNRLMEALGMGELEQSWTTKMELVVIQVRLPRIIAACFIGAALSSAGAVYQGMFKNPMVSPDILGSSQGAGFGAALAIIIGFGAGGVSALSFIGGIAAVAIALMAASRYKNNPVLGLVLAGIMVGSLFSAGTSFIKLVADPTDDLPAITYWLMGSLSSIRTSQLLLLCPCVMAGLIPMMLLRWRLNIITLGEDQARSLGVNTKLLRWLIVACATLMSGACVAVSGMIGWVGLVIPHFARRLVGCDYRHLLPAGMLIGATFMLAVDDIARTAAATEIPIGILTAFVGAPFFLWMILREGGKK